MIPGAVRIFVCTEPMDMRQGFDRLAQVVKAKLGEDPESGSLFVFSNRGATRLKALWFDRNGYCVLYKRLHRAVFELPAPSGRRVRSRSMPRDSRNFFAGSDANDVEEIDARARWPLDSRSRDRQRMFA